MIVNLLSKWEILIILVSCKPDILDLLHSDVFGMLVKCMGGVACFICFIDDYSRKIWVCLFKRKIGEFDAFKFSYAFLANQEEQK